MACAWHVHGMCMGMCMVHGHGYVHGMCMACALVCAWYMPPSQTSSACLAMHLHTPLHAPLQPLPRVCAQVHVLLSALETFDGGALALWSMDELAQARGKSEHFKTRLASTTMARYHSRLLSMCWAAWLSLVWARRTARHARHASHEARQQGAKLKKGLALSERLRTEARAEADDELEQAWSEAMNWQCTAHKQQQASPSPRPPRTPALCPPYAAPPLRTSFHLPASSPPPALPLPPASPHPAPPAFS